MAAAAVVAGGHKMNPLLKGELDEILDERPPVAGLGCERSLRVAAAVVARARPHEISATRIVGVLRPDDMSAFEALVTELEEEFELDASVRLQMGSFSVRFCRQTCAV
jgi:hypothetical protein